MADLPIFLRLRTAEDILEQFIGYPIPAEKLVTVKKKEGGALSLCLANRDVCGKSPVEVLKLPDSFGACRLQTIKKAKGKDGWWVGLQADVKRLERLDQAADRAVADVASFLANGMTTAELNDMGDDGADDDESEAA